jgi:hypothetical protein
VVKVLHTSLLEYHCGRLQSIPLGKLCTDASTSGPAPKYSAPCAKLLWRPPPLVYIIDWYMCLTISRVKVHKYFFRCEDYDGICWSTTRDTWNCQLIRLWRQRRRADARQTHMDYLRNKPRRRIFKFMIRNWRPYTLGALCRGIGCTPLEPVL